MESEWLCYVYVPFFISHSWKGGGKKDTENVKRNQDISLMSSYLLSHNWGAITIFPLTLLDSGHKSGNANKYVLTVCAQHPPFHNNIQQPIV